MMRALAWVSLALGAVLAGLTLAGGALPEPHPRKIAGEETGKAEPAPATLEALAAARQIKDPEARLRREVAIVDAALVHYWPGAAEEPDPAILYGALESWPVALLQRIELLRIKAGLAEPRLILLERRDHSAALAKGVGLCSQAALALADYLQGEGDAVRIAVLQGHVVAQVTRGTRTFLADADYDVVLPYPLSEAEKRPADVAAAYRAAGVEPALAERLARIYGPEDNKLVEPDHYMASAAKTLRQAAVAAWLVPAMLIALGLWGLLRWRPRQAKSSVSTSVPSATR